jgi:serine/threonine protein kinase
VISLDSLENPDTPDTPDIGLGESVAGPALPAPGTRIGPYEIIRELGRGGMDAVYAARDTKLGRKVAIKLLYNDQPELTARFILEARTTARCNHENIIVIYEAGEHGGHPFMVLEHLQGAPLTRLIQEGRKLPPAQAVELIVPVVRALTVAHAHGIVHRDLKPDNIFVTDAGTIKVLDFGIAKLLQGKDEDGAARARGAGVRTPMPSAGVRRELTRRGAVIGTLPYMSPEQWGAGGGIVDPQTDLWAVGIILFKMVAGHHPLAPRQGWDLMITGVLQEPMPSVRGACPDLPDELAAVIDRCLQTPKDRRVGSARELLDALEPLLCFLTPPSRDGLRDALIQPAEMAGYQFETPEMVESMLDHLEHTPGALPLLQFAASQLWEMRDREHRRLTAASYDRIGGIAGALASHADTVLAECTAREQALVRALFLRLITPERTRAIVPMDELRELSPDPAELDRAIERLVRSRLLVGQLTGDERGAPVTGGSIELVHESLIHRWPLLRRWLDETQEDAAFLEQLRNTAKQWQARGYPQGLLWRGEAMQEARLWHGRYRGELPALQRAYLGAVFALAARATRRRRWAVIAAMSLLSALALAATVALVMIRDAQQEATAQAERVQDQLVLTQTAEISAQAERARAVAASHKLESQNASLRAAIEAATRARLEAEDARLEAEEARLRAEGSKRLERQSRRRATSAARRASAAAAEARLASEKLQALLAVERLRVQELEELTKGVGIVPDVSLE